MKVFYNSKLAKALTFMEGFGTIMLFGMVFTEKNELGGRTLKHEETHCRQYKDMFALGTSISILLLFLMLGFDVRGWWMLALVIIPVGLFYMEYLLEYLILRIKGFGKKEAYRNISLERHAVWIAETWEKPCLEQNCYVSFGWIKYI